MNIQIKKKDIVLIFGGTLLVLIVAIASARIIGQSSMMLALALLTIMVLLCLVAIYRRLYDERLSIQSKLSGEIRNESRQTEALLSLYFILQPDMPLPDTRGWAASPDFLKKISEIILSRKPALVVEASSGISTLVTAYCLKKLGAGKVVSLEHDAEYAEINKAVIELHGLSDIATILHAPLKEYEIEGNKWRWYDIEGLDAGQPIDMLIVDGPPATVQKLARYPVLPILAERLQKGSVIMLDDGGRPDETEIVKRWKREFDGISDAYCEFEKGAYVIDLETAPVPS